MHFNCQLPSTQMSMVSGSCVGVVRGKAWRGMFSTLQLRGRSARGVILLTYAGMLCITSYCFPARESPCLRMKIHTRDGIGSTLGKLCPEEGNLLRLLAGNWAVDAYTHLYLDKHCNPYLIFLTKTQSYSNCLQYRPWLLPIFSNLFSPRLLKSHGMESWDYASGSVWYQKSSRARNDFFLMGPGSAETWLWGSGWCLCWGMLAFCWKSSSAGTEKGFLQPQCLKTRAAFSEHTRYYLFMVGEKQNQWTTEKPNLNRCIFLHHDFKPYLMIIL